MIGKKIEKAKTRYAEAVAKERRTESQRAELLADLVAAEDRGVQDTSKLREGVAAARQNAEVSKLVAVKAEKALRHEITKLVDDEIKALPRRQADYNKRVIEALEFAGGSVSTLISILSTDPVFSSIRGRLEKIRDAFLRPVAYNDYPDIPVDCRDAIKRGLKSSTPDENTFSELAKLRQELSNLSMVLRTQSYRDNYEQKRFFRLMKS